MKRMALAVFLVVAAVSMASGSGSLRIAIDRNPRNLNPVFADDSASYDVISDIFDPLIQLNAKGELEPVLAAALPVVSADGKTISFVLRKGVLWHDGVELTTADVAFSLALLQDEDINSPNLGYLDSVERLEVIDRYAFVVHLSDVDSQIMRDFTYEWIVPEHLLGSMDKKTMENGEYSRMPVGNGRFRISAYTQNERIVVTAFEKYHGTKSSLDEIVRLITPSATTSLLKVETGEAEMAFVNPADRERMSAKKGIGLFVYPSTAFDCIQYNIQTTFFADKRVRQAFSYAINVPAIIKGIYKSGSVPAATSYPEGFWFSEPAVKPYGYNLKKARSLLAEAGWKPGADGILVKDGVRFEIDILTNKGDEQREKLVVYLQSAYKALGVAVNPRILEWNTLFDTYIDTGDFDAYVGGYGGSSYPVQNYYRTGAYLNAGKYSNMRLDELMMTIRGTFNQDEQKSAAREIQKILSDEQPFTYVVFKTGSWVVSKNVMGARFIPFRGAFEMHLWSVKK